MPILDPAARYERDRLKEIAFAKQYGHGNFSTGHGFKPTGRLSTLPPTQQRLPGTFTAPLTIESIIAHQFYDDDLIPTYPLYPTKETPPVSIPQRKRNIQKTLANLAEQLEALSGFPDTDPFGDGAILCYNVTFDEVSWRTGQQTYTYAALRAGGTWYTTSRYGSSGPFTWDQCVDFWIDKRVAPGDVYWAPAVEPAFDD